MTPRSARSLRPALARLRALGALTPVILAAAVVFLVALVLSHGVG